MVALRRLLWSWPARRAARRTPHAFSGEASRHRVDRFVAGTRIAFILCAFLAIIVDPSRSARNAPSVLAIAIAYTFYSLTTMWWAWASAASLGERARLAIQIIDVGVAIVLMSLSGGTHSPFFAFMVFPLLSASLQWRRGALWTGGVSLAAYGGVALNTMLRSGTAALEVPSLFIESVYLVIVTLVLAYLAAHDDRTRRELGGVAAWTTSQSGDAGSRLRDILSHVAAVVDAPRVLLVWQAADQPRPNSALWTHGQLHWMADAPAAFELPAAESLGNSDFVCSDATRSDAHVVVCRTHSQSWRWHGRPFSDDFRSTFAIRAVIAVCLHSASLRGRLFVLDKPHPTSDDLVLATVVARQVENVLEHDSCARRLLDAALAHERARIARDVHDGALQWLAGAALRLEMIRRHLEDNPTAALDALHDLQAAIMLQQRELRSFVRELQTGGCGKDLGLADLLAGLVLRIEREWQLPVQLDVKLSSERFDQPISPELAREIHQIVREALVNAARHTLASLAQVSVGLDGDKVRITVADNGQGFPFRGRFEDAELAERNLGPVMLRQRIAALGGRLVIDTSDDGARLEISLPRHGANGTVGRAGPHPYPPSVLARSSPLV